MFELRPFQRQAIEALRVPGHIICVSATGSGKSLIYERTIADRRFRTLLISPLIALARQQAERLKAHGLKVQLFSGERCGTAADTTSADVWIVSPESLCFNSRHAMLLRWKPEFLVVDECHCFWDWGDGFRPAFNMLPDLIETYGISRSVWLTATLPGEARATLRERLPAPLTEIGSFELPPRLFLSMIRVPWIHRTQALLEWIFRRPSPGIIFVCTRDTTARVARLVISSGRNAVIYHAGMSSEERRLTEARLSNGSSDIVIATSAFGMGMDYSHFRWVVLWQAPSSVLGLTQAIGRVGRGTEMAEAVVFWDYDDFRLLEWTLGNSERKRRELTSLLGILEAPGCRRRALSAYYGLKTSPTCGELCDFCISRPLFQSK